MRRLLSSRTTSAVAKPRVPRERWAARRRNLLPHALTASFQYEHKNPFPFDDIATHPTSATPEQRARSMLGLVQPTLASRFWPLVDAGSSEGGDALRTPGQYFGELRTTSASASAMQCEQCRRHFVSFHELMTHKHTKSVVRPFECKFCSKDFETKLQLHQHLQFHYGTKAWECDFCGKALSRYSTYLRHLERHSPSAATTTTTTGV